MNANLDDKFFLYICGSLEVNDRLLYSYIKHCVMSTEWHDFCTERLIAFTERERESY